MPRKIPFLISTLMLASSLTGPVNAFATATEDEGETLRYWTVDQLIELNDQVETERNLRCAGDSACEREFNEELRMSESPEYGALDTFLSFRLLISRINPSAETIHVVYHDVDEMMRQFGETKHELLSEFNVVWLDSSAPDPRTDFTWSGHPHFVDQIHNNALEDTTHLLVSKSIEKDGQNFITPNVEFEFKTLGNELSSNTTGILHHAGVIGTWQPYSGIEYGECLASPDYAPGKECRYVFYEDYTRAYLPFDVETTSEETPNNTTPDTPEESTSTNESGVPTSGETTETSPETTPGSTSEIVSIATTTPVPVISTSVIRVLERSETASDKENTESEEKTAEKASESTTETPENPNDYVEVPLAAGSTKENSIFPWWLIVIIFGLIGIMLTWFIVLRDKTQKK